MQKERREFFKTVAKVFSLGLLLPFENLFAKTKRKISLPKKKRDWDLVAVKGGSPAEMFVSGINAMGGMENFVKKGQTVLIKPNIGWNRPPMAGANTNPDLVGKIIELAYKSGAKRVEVFDHTCNEEIECYRNSGIEKVCRSKGAVLLPASDEKYYRKIKIPGAKIVKDALVHKSYLEADVVINVPILKQHSGARMTAAIKNYMGIVWDRRYWHRHGLMEAISEFGLIEKKPALNVVDAYFVMTRNGPRGLTSNDLIQKKMLLLSKDIVLVDTASAKVLGVSPKEIPYLKMAENLGLGTMDLKKSKIRKISIRS